MRRTLTVLVLIGFLTFTGIYVFVYLFRAFRLPDPVEEATVYIWHGDPMMRAVLVAVLFLIGLVLLLFVSIATSASRRDGSVSVRSDLWEWLNQRADDTNEDPGRIAERALAQYRDEVEGQVRRV
jgi:hypothetical protein